MGDAIAPSFFAYEKYKEYGLGEPQARLLAEAYEQCLFAGGTDTSFLLTDTSLITLQNYAAETIGYRKRRQGNIFEITHYMESAVWIFNCHAPALNDTDSIERAFLLFAHDLRETLFKHGITEMDIVRATWRGDKDRIPYLVEALEEFLDDRDLPKAARLMNQATRSRYWLKDGIVPYGHFGEKLCTYKRDLYNIENDFLVFTDRHDAEIYLDNILLPRQEVVSYLALDDDHHQEFNNLVAQIRLAIDEQLTRDLDRSGAHSNLYTRPKNHDPSALSLVAEMKKIGFHSENLKVG